MTALDLIKEALKGARETFEGTVADLTPDMFAQQVGAALPIEAVCAHLLLSEDMTINKLLQGKPPLFESTWQNKTGVSPLMPPMGATWNEDHAKWAKEVTVDLPAFNKYKQAVYAQTDAYINSLTDADLDREVDMGDWGKKPVYYLLIAWIIAHTNNLAGEISAAKGFQNKKGYAF